MESTWKVHGKYMVMTYYEVPTEKMWKIKCKAFEVIKENRPKK